MLIGLAIGFTLITGIVAGVLGTYFYLAYEMWRDGPP